MAKYRIAVNIEWTSKCNAACVMCPRDKIPDLLVMDIGTFRQVLDRLSPAEAFRAVIAGYGEPTTHPRFEEFIGMVREHPLNFDMVSNGQLLDADRLDLLDGVVGTLIISFSSTTREIYERVHVNLDCELVMDNIALAVRRLKKTKLAISLTPMPECLATLPTTIKWLHGLGIKNLTMSPSLYDRAGTFHDATQSYKDLRGIIRDFDLHSQELDFVPSAREIAAQWLFNRYKCIPRNTDFLISALGEYMYCFNDIAHSRPLGHVADMSLRDALRLREKSSIDHDICDACSIRKRYRPAELITAALGYLKMRMT
ncbi:MAG: radical SAM protein [Rhodospirillales bacterium RIFCSPLOWO2_12_FULL_58_28]|nr:MAG: radical SAM protein [Rhodospirillales bacterium RIFCSPLOWO2_02_FULL_58_16]OHC79127.1 MAG: radical SAM protein [Rhodospirillales bacterium RIFCSPLOWO2_12_FULL_58_28]